MYEANILTLTFRLVVGLALAATVTLTVTEVASAQGGTIYQATLAEPNQKTRRSARRSSGASWPTAAPSSWIPGNARSKWRVTFPAHGTPRRGPVAPISEFVAEVERSLAATRQRRWSSTVTAHSAGQQAAQRQLLAAGSPRAPIPARHPGLARRSAG